MDELTKLPLNFGLDWIRTQSDQRLVAYQAEINALFEEISTANARIFLEPQARKKIRFLLEFLRRTQGLSDAIAFINTLNQREPKETLFVMKAQFLQEHAGAHDLEEYLNEQQDLKGSHPEYLFLQFEHDLALGKKDRLNALIDRLIFNQDGSGLLLEAITLATAMQIPFDSSTLVRQVKWGRTFLMLWEHLQCLKVDSELPVTYCINLDRSVDRIRRCAPLHQKSTEWVRFAAVDGTNLDEVTLEQFNINQRLPRSAIGCSLSHFGVWQKIANEKQLDRLHIVVEDDALPLWGTPSCYQTAWRMMKEQNLDLVYVQNRATPLLFTLREFNKFWSPAIMPFTQGLQRFAFYKCPYPGGWGADGYLISAQGASKLVSLIQRDGLTNHIDWQTFLYSTPDWTNPLMKPKQNVAFNYKNTCGRDPQMEIKTGIMNVPLFVHADLGLSTR